MSRNSLLLEGLNKTFKGRRGEPVTALDDVHIALSPGELLVLLGPSGCGKSTTLRCVAGLESPDAGAIRFGEKVVFDAARRTDVPTEKRDLGMVFQHFALWPHMTVHEIVAFPLKARREAKADRTRKVNEALELVGCGELAHRHPSQLSGGQQQRVALARALVAQPQVMLFDEPLSNLDAGLRADLRSEIARLHRSTGFAGIYVTHDQVEALAVADRIAVMRGGRVVQLGSALDVYAHPVDEWVAGFMGFTNRLEARTPQVIAPALTSSGRPHAYRFRPESVQLLLHGFSTPQAEHLVFEGKILDSAFVGSGYEYRIEVGAHRVDARVPVQDLATAPSSANNGQVMRFAVATADVIGFGSPASTSEHENGLMSEGAEGAAAAVKD